MMATQPKIKLTPAEFRSMIGDRDRLRRAIEEIGNIAGGPEMRYAKNVNLEQMRERLQKIVEIVIDILGLKNGKDASS